MISSHPQTLPPALLHHKGGGKWPHQEPIKHSVLPRQELLPCQPPPFSLDAWVYLSTWDLHHYTAEHFCLGWKSPWYHAFFFLLPLVLFHSTNIPQPGTGLGAGNAGWIAEPRSPFPWSCSLQNISPSISRTLSLGGREGHHCNSHFLDDETNNCLSIFAPGYEVIGLD